MPNINSIWLHVVVLALLCLPFFINLGAASIWDGSEAFYAETAREMLASGDWLSPRFNFEPRVNKPPLTYWIIAVSYKIFGVNEFAVRFPGALAALGVTLFAWGAARSFYGTRAALFAAVIAAATPRIFILERRLPIDILLLFFLTGTLFFLLRAAVSATSENPWERGRLARIFLKNAGIMPALPAKNEVFGACLSIREPAKTQKPPRAPHAIPLICAYVFAALGFLTKGPVAVIIPAGALAVWMCYARKLRFSDLLPLRGAAIFLCVVLPWYVLSYFARGWDYISQFFLSDNLGRFASESFGPARTFYYYVPIWFSDFFPWSLIGTAALISLGATSFRERLKEVTFGLPFFWCALTFLLFSLSKNKQEYYIAPMYPAAAILVAGLLAKAGQMKERFAEGAAKIAGRGSFRLLPPIYGILAFLLFVSAFVLPYILDILIPGINEALRLTPSFILVAGAGLTAWNACRKKLNRAFASLAFSIWIIFFSGALMYVPALEIFRPVKDFCAAIENEIRADADASADNRETEIGYFSASHARHSMAFYLKRRIFEEDDYARMLRRFLSDSRVFCILDDRDYDWFAEKGAPLFILDRRAHFSIRFNQLIENEKHNERLLLLVSNRQPGGNVR